MQRKILNVLAAGILLSLAGCQSTPVNTMFSPFSSPATTSATLAQSVEDALRQSEDPVVAQVHVETNQNIVTLRGYVKKIRQSDIAEQIARKVPGVQRVDNNLIVRQ